MAKIGDETTLRVRTLLDVTGITVEGEDFDAVARLYQRFAGQRETLASADIGDAEPVTIAVFHPGGDHANERR